jgi:hypothetical protein
MTTTYRRALVSLVAGVTIALGTAGCAATTLGSATDAPSPLDIRQADIRFDNDGSEHVHVYLVDDRRQWLLGRVEPGAKAMLRLPKDALGEASSFVRLVVVAGEPVTLQPARHPRAALTVSLPPWQVMSRRWFFAQGDLMSLVR